MDLDAYVLAHAHEWQRLEQLGHRRRLSGAESDELVERYQQVATHLSVVRTSAPDAALVAHLSSVLARARNRAVGARVSSWSGFVGFFTERFPAALYRLRYWWLGCLAVNVVVVAVLILWLLDHPNVEQSLMSPAEIDQLVNHDVEGYTASTPPATSPSRCGSTTRGCPRSAWPSASSACRSSTCSGTTC